MWARLTSLLSVTAFSYRFHKRIQIEQESVGEARRERFALAFGTALLSYPLGLPIPGAKLSQRANTTTLKGPSTCRKIISLKQTLSAAETWYCLVYGTHRFPRGVIINSFHGVKLSTTVPPLCNTNCYSLSDTEHSDLRTSAIVAAGTAYATANASNSSAICSLL